MDKDKLNIANKLNSEILDIQFRIKSLEFDISEIKKDSPGIDALDISDSDFKYISKKDQAEVGSHVLTLLKDILKDKTEKFNNL